jgi:hypothetical protein
MKSPLVIVLVALVLVTVNTLAVMNKARKSRCVVRPDAASHEIWAQLSVLRAILRDVP